MADRFFDSDRRLGNFHDSSNGMGGASASANGSGVRPISMLSLVSHPGLWCGWSFHHEPVRACKNRQSVLPCLHITPQAALSELTDHRLAKYETLAIDLSLKASVATTLSRLLASVVRQSICTTGSNIFQDR